MNYKINVKNLYKSLNQLRDNGALSALEFTKIKETVEGIEKGIKTNKIPTSKESKSVDEAISIMLKLAINKPITPDLRTTVNSFVLLISYWDDIVGGQSDFKSSISTVQKFVDYHLTVMETITVLRRLIPRMEQMMNFSPPAIELSKHYLKSLESSDRKKDGDKKNKSY